jgi:hypothetical protein
MMAGRRKTNRKAGSGDATLAVERAAPAQGAAAPLDPPDSLTSTRRKLCNMLEFWRVCAKRTCKRRRACMGDADTCAIFWMRHVPQRYKALLRHTARHLNEGASSAEASRLANEDLAPYDAAVDKMPLDERPDGWDFGRDNIPPPPPPRPVFDLPPIRRVEPPSVTIDDTAAVPPPRPDPPPMPAPAMLRCGQRQRG